jgi:hypothetical protein
MKALAEELDWSDLPLDVRPFLSEKQTFVTVEREYEVYAISIYKKVPFLLVVDDLGTPVFLPSLAFSLISNELRNNWMCNMHLGGEVDLVIGPDFIARDLGAYVAMIDQETEALQQFWLYRSGLDDADDPDRE